MGSLVQLANAVDTGLHEGHVFESTRHLLEAAQPEHPVYLFHPRRLQRRARYFRARFPGTVGYAIKANSRRRVIRTLVRAGIADFDVASLNEIQLVSAHGEGARLHFNNPVKPEHAIHTAYRRYGVRSFALDDRFELTKILANCDAPRSLLLSVRFKLDNHQAAYDFGAKFGADPDVAAALLATIRQAGARPALTFHPGSQCTDPREYRRYIQAAAEISRRASVPLAQLNVGGGFPEHYLNATLLPRSHYFDLIRQSAADAFAGRPPRLMCEPGRAMVASSVSLLCRVIHVRPRQRVVFINDGIYGGLQEQSQAELPLPLKAWRGSETLAGTVEGFTVFGPTCDPVDRLPCQLHLPRAIRAGDYIEFDLVGAYGSATATHFNGFDSSRYVDLSGG